MRKLLALALATSFVALVACNKAEETPAVDTTAVDTTKVDTAAADTTKSDTAKADTTVKADSTKK